MLGEQTFEGRRESLSQANKLSRTHVLLVEALNRHPRGRDDEERLTADIIALARQYGRYGYRKVAALLRDAGWLINAKRVERIWRREGLKVSPTAQTRATMADGQLVHPAAAFASQCPF